MSRLLSFLQPSLAALQQDMQAGRLCPELWKYKEKTEGLADLGDTKNCLTGAKLERKESETPTRPRRGLGGTRSLLSCCLSCPPLTGIAAASSSQLALLLYVSMSTFSLPPFFPYGFLLILQESTQDSPPWRSLLWSSLCWISCPGSRCSGNTTHIYVGIYHSQLELLMLRSFSSVTLKGLWEKSDLFIIAILQPSIMRSPWQRVGI